MLTAKTIALDGSGATPYLDFLTTNAERTEGDFTVATNDIFLEDNYPIVVRAEVDNGIGVILFDTFFFNLRLSGVCGDSVFGDQAIADTVTTVKLGSVVSTDIDLYTDSAS